MIGSIYAEHVLKVPRPRIGLLNIGEEVEKGDALARETHGLMRSADLNFVGNVEGNDLISHVADVVVCDGFVGNVVIKFFEGLTSYIFRSLRTDLQQGAVAPIALLALKPGFDRLKHRFDYERYGGAPLLGVQGVSIVTHAVPGRAWWSMRCGLPPKQRRRTPPHRGVESQAPGSGSHRWRPDARRCVGVDRGRRVDRHRTWSRGLSQVAAAPRRWARSGSAGAALAMLSCSRTSSARPGRCDA